MRWLGDKSLASSQALPPGRVPHVRVLRTWVEDDLFPMLSPPVSTYLQEKKEEGLPPDFLWSLGGVGAPHAAFLAESRVSVMPSQTIV
jgi:hypothetical protein